MTLTMLQGLERALGTKDLKDKAVFKGLEKTGTIDKTIKFFKACADFLILIARVTSAGSSSFIKGTISLGKAMSTARKITGLAKAWASIPRMVQGMRDSVTLLRQIREGDGEKFCLDAKGRKTGIQTNHQHWVETLTEKRLAATALILRFFASVTTFVGFGVARPVSLGDEHWGPSHNRHIDNLGNWTFRYAMFATHASTLGACAVEATLAHTLYSKAEKTREAWLHFAERMLSIAGDAAEQAGEFVLDFITHPQFAAKVPPAVAPVIGFITATIGLVNAWSRV